MKTIRIQDLDLMLIGINVIYLVSSIAVLSAVLYS
jgi:hypothetical protein